MVRMMFGVITRMMMTTGMSAIQDLGVAKMYEKKYEKATNCTLKSKKMKKFNPFMPPEKSVMVAAPQLIHMMMVGISNMR